MKTLGPGLLMIAAGWAAAQAPAPTGASGASLYEAGRFEQAEGAFAEESAREPDAPWPHYNRGNALFKAGRLGPAIASYLRAYERDPRDEDIRFNLDFALRRAGDSLYPAGAPPALHTAWHALALEELEGLQWLVLWAVLALACVWLVSERSRDALFVPLLVAGSMWALPLGWWGLRQAGEPRPLAVTVQPRTELRNGPGDGFSVGFTAPEGRRVRVLEDRGDWLEIGVLKEGVKGWVRRDSIEPV